MATIQTEHRQCFFPKLEQVVALLLWLTEELRPLGRPVWVATEGVSVKRPSLPAARGLQIVVSRLREDVPPWSVPPLAAAEIPSGRPPGWW